MWRKVWWAIAIPFIIFLFLVGFVSGVFWIPVILAIVLVAIPYLLGFYRERSVAAVTGKKMPSGASGRDVIGGNDVPERRDE